MPVAAMSLGHECACACPLVVCVFSACACGRVGESVAVCPVLSSLVEPLTSTERNSAVTSACASVVISSDLYVPHVFGSSLALMCFSARRGAVFPLPLPMSLRWQYHSIVSRRQNSPVYLSLHPAPLHSPATSCSIERTGHYHGGRAAEIDSTASSVGGVAG